MPGEGTSLQNAHESASRTRFAAAGSVMFTRRLSTERSPAFRQLLDVIREADVGFLNVEGPIVEPSAYPLKQYVFSSYVSCESWMAEELSAAGFNMASLANNHMSDWSPEAIDTNRRLLERAGIVCSGAGRTLSDARAPAFLDLPPGRVALISVDSSYEHDEFLQVQMASDPHGGVRGRPGTNGLRWDQRFELDDRSFEALRSIYRSLGLQQGDLALGNRPPPTEDRFYFRGAIVERAGAARQGSTCHPGDLAEILRWIRSARSMADYVLVSHHTHAWRGDLWEFPADFAVEFAHAAIDEGADAYIGHGALPKGIEIYKGRPVFYDLADWGTQDASQRRHPGDAYEHWGLDPKATPGDFADARESHRDPGSMLPEQRAIYDAYRTITNQSLLVSFTFTKGRLSELKLYPTVMSDGARHERGTPLLAQGEAAVAVLGHFAMASAPYGTEIEVVDGVGEVKIG